jgi:predicted RNA-binding protein
MKEVRQIMKRHVLIQTYVRVRIDNVLNNLPCSRRKPWWARKSCMADLQKEVKEKFIEIILAFHRETKI